MFHNAVFEQLKTLKSQYFGVLVSLLISETKALGPDSQKYLGMLDPTGLCDQVTQLQLLWRLELSLLRSRLALLRILPIIYRNKESF